MDDEEGKEASSKKQGASQLVKDKNLVDVIFSWSVDDILNGDLYKDQVGKIPDAFESIENYLSSFVYPLLEETRSDICSKIGSISTAPFGKVISVERPKQQSRKLFYYDLMVEDWKYNSNNSEKDPYRTKPGDIIAFTEATPGQYLDVERLRRRCNLGYVTNVLRDDCMYAHFEVRTSRELELGKDGWNKSLYAVFVANVTTSNRIWKALRFNQNLDVIKETLGTNSMVQGCCMLCPSEMKKKLEDRLCLPSYLNKSQRQAILECVFKSHCAHKSSLELIWGPPGTGKTRTLAVMLWSLLQLKCRTLICCPTNVAISEIASRVMKLVNEDDTSLYSLGDILLYGNIDQTAYVIEEMCLDYRVKKLSECLGDGTGWRHCIITMIELLEDCVLKYKNFCDSKIVKDDHKYVNDGESFLNFIRDNFIATASSVRNCISTIFTHLPKKFIREHNYKDMVALMTMLDSFESFLFQTNVVGEELKEAFVCEEEFESLTHVNANVSRFLNAKGECVRFLRNLLSALDGLDLPKCDKDSIEEFCYKMASLIFCTASSSYKLQSVKMYPMKLLVIDEASQLKECELLVPLQVPSIKHVVLLGDECQLPAFVSSKVSAEAGIGRSLFERLSTLGFTRHLLDTQYRMHPNISKFPNAKFYQNRIMDAEIVKSDIYEKCYIPDPMFGSYSFMNISCGRESHTDTHSLTNMVEVAVLLKIIHRVYKACEAAKVKVTVGVVSPYSAQVSEIQRRLGKKYDDNDSFKVHIRTIDGFQGGEDDIVIISTVRSNQRGSLGFTSSPRRINVALTRARHCLWILGNEETLSKSDSVWEQLVLDAKVRQCFFNADDDKGLQAVIMEVKKELDQLGDMLKEDSMFFRNARWKLMFSGSFTKSFKKLESETQNLVLLFLSKLANGWRPKRVNSDVSSEISTKILKQYKIGTYYILCSVDICKELWYIQTLKVWEILPLQDIPKMIRRLEHIFQMYTEDYISRCSKKCVEGKLEVPMTWAASENIVQYKSLSNTETGESSNTSDLDGRCLENSSVRESLLLMKFYSLSCGAMSNLLSGCDGESLGIPFELTDQERDIVLFNRSSFILGRSGTGKTTVLTMKLFRNDQLYHVASEGYHEVRTDPSYEEQRNEYKKGDILRQLFVTVSPKLCYAVREQFSQLKRSVCGGDSLPECHLIQTDAIDEAMHSTDIPDSLYELPPNAYPLIITFQKFLMMLDGTIGISYFDRFPILRQSSHSAMGKLRSVALQTFIRTKEITFEKFDSLYWPHFNKDLTRKLCSLTVFTEIMSVIKGGLQATNDAVGTLCQQEYVALSSNRGSTLSMEKRVHIYKIFLDYEKRKVANGEFDQADLVLDLHRRLKDKRYNGDEIDFVFIDEVQDLSMRQISLFKYICKNVDDGFSFSGDTAQTIAKGINFRFEDIRYLFYRDFLGQENEKGKISSLFQLSYNFRTHIGILKLAQTVINLICHFFPYSIDFLNPETSLISGESPVLLETEGLDALRILFGNPGNVIAFGAEQVILVRDDRLKKEICDSVGKKALVLTIFECKGLEFQDVLLYRFFSSSPFENEWRVIYEYMNDNNMLGSTASTSFPRFDLEKHGILCSELKQLYVAVTRTKQRLWICENSKDFSGPMFDYWKKLCVAKVRKMDDSFIKEMQVESNEEDWRSRGIKLFHENNYEMAMMCFERAGDPFWAKLAEASLYQAAARRRESNSEMARKYLKRAAEIFDAIGKAESAAGLFVEIEEYERAGFIYLNILPEPKLEKAGECFCLGKCFRRAAKVYASGGLYSKCISACIYGKLFEMGMKYMQEWRQTGILVKYKVEINRIVQEFLRNGAIYYYEQHDYKQMMKFVESFESKDAMRQFLNDFRLHRELLYLEEKWGNFQDAARIANQIGDSLLEADLLSKCGVFQEASLIRLWYVFTELIRTSKGKYSPYHFKDKDDILEKAMSTAKSHSDSFYDFACMEASILSAPKSAEKIPESGLKFVRNWRQNVPAGLVKTSFELNKIEQELLERCARHYHNLKDTETMMKFVESFESKDSMRNFLNDFRLHRELLYLEDKWGNFQDAARIAKQIGDSLLEADLLSKCGVFKEASLIRLWYVFTELTRTTKGKYSPYHFKHKDDILEKAMSTAKSHSDSFYDFACMEASILSAPKSADEIPESGLKFVRHWRKNVPVGLVKTSFELNKTEQELLERCALRYHNLEDTETMMKFVEDFRSKDLIRSFLKDLKLLKELLDLEIRWGNFLEAAKIAKKMGDCLLEADLLSKCGIYREASLIMLWYVFSSQTRSTEGNYRHQINSKDEILKKAVSYAKRHSDSFYKFVCTEANILLEMGDAEEQLEPRLQFVRHWRQEVADGLVKTSSDLAKIEQDLLQSCAQLYYDLNDFKTMMKFVVDFQSFDLRQAFFNKLILLEEKQGNFSAAAEIAELKVDVLQKSDLLLKGRYFKEASLLILWYVFAESVWVHGSRGWPMGHFAQKEEFLKKAKQSAKKHSDQFYLFVCREANMMSDQGISLSELGKYLSASPVHRSLRSEILASRRVLDVHINSLLAFEWNGEVVKNLENHVEDKLSQNQISVETLFFVWNFWKGKILELIEYLCCKGGQDVGEYSDLEDYILNYFGVRKNCHNQQMLYVVSSGAKWVGEIDSTKLSSAGNLVCIDLHNFVTAALSHFSSGLYSVGVEVLVSLKLLSTQCRIKSVSVFGRILCLVHMFEIAKFLENYKFPNFKYTGNWTVRTYLKLSSGDFFDNVFHIDFRMSLLKDLILLRGREVSFNLLEEATLGPLYVTDVPTTEQMGRLVTMILGSCKRSLPLDKILVKISEMSQTWMDFIETINSVKKSGFVSDVSPCDASAIEVSVAYSIFALLKENICADWSPQNAFLSPSCFLYLAERLLVMVSYFQGFLFVTKSSCVEWLIYEGWNVPLSPIKTPLVIGDVYNFLSVQIQMLLLNKHDTLLWIGSSLNNSEYYQHLVLRLVVLMCLICVNSGQHYEGLFSLLERNDISSELPREFCDALKRTDCYFIAAVAEAFARIGNPLVIMSLVENFAECPCSNAIFLNVEKLGSNDLLNELLPVAGDTSMTHDNFKELVLGKPHSIFWEIISELVAFDKETGSFMQFKSTAPVIKVEMEKMSSLLSHMIALTLEASKLKNDEELLHEANIMIDELNQLSYALDIRNLCEDNTQTVVKISEGLQSRRLKMEPFLDHLYMQMRQESMLN
ncbi:hypothetical protein ACET3Z_024586 [Daucus carota]